jgi:hypothetical protein
LIGCDGLKPRVLLFLPWKVPPWNWMGALARSLRESCSYMR